MRPPPALRVHVSRRVRDCPRIPPAVLPCPARLSQTCAFRVPRLVAAVEVGDARFVSDARSMTSNPRWMQRAELVLAGEDVDEQVARVSVWDKRTSNRKSGENMTCLGAAVFPLARLETFRPTRWTSRWRARVTARASRSCSSCGTREGKRNEKTRKRKEPKRKRGRAARRRRPRLRARARPGRRTRSLMPRYTTGRQKRETKKTGHTWDRER